MLCVLETKAVVAPSEHPGAFPQLPLALCPGSLGPLDLTGVPTLEPKLAGGIAHGGGGGIHEARELRLEDGVVPLADGGASKGP